MAERIQIDSTALRAIAPDFAAMAAACDGLLRNLSGVLDAEGSCWGHDQTGAAFAEAYVPAAQQLSRGLTGLARVVREVGGAIGTVADTVDASEDRAKLRLGNGDVA